MLKFNNIILNKKSIRKRKEPIDLLWVNIDRIVVSDNLNIITKALSISLVT